MVQTTRQRSNPAINRRKLARAERAVKRRKAERLERKLLREKALTQTKVAGAVSTEVKRNKVVTFEDLDGDQLIAYRGIHQWWDAQAAIGGFAEPLTVGGYAGCFDKDTEYFSQRGWVKFSDYKDGDLVGQYCPDTEKLQLVNPLEYVKKDADILTEFKSQGVDQCLSLGHRVVYWTHKDDKSVPKVLPFHEVKDRHLRSSKGWSGKFKTTFKSDMEDFDISEGHLRLQVAVNADGRVVKCGANNYTQMRFNKERKYLRLLDICKSHNLPFKDHGINSQGDYEIIVFPKYSSKRYDQWYYSLSQSQLEVINDEVVHWDGSLQKSLRRYFSVFKCDADFIQYVFASTGQNTSISKDSRQECYTQTGECFTVNGSSSFGNGFRTIQGKGYKTEMRDYPTKDGKMYCFSVPTGMLVVRRNDKIVISGNTGKSTLLSICLPELKNSDGSDVIVKYCAYTGKAANVLNQKGLPSQTMHSLIYIPLPLPCGGVEFELKDRSEVDCQLIVVDEASMIPDDMQKDLESLKIPILYTGDHGQLPPVQGFGNVMANPVYKLETPHRQALESGIIEVATMFREKKRVRNGVYGQNKDTEVVSRKAIDDIKLLSGADMVVCYTNSTRQSINDRIRDYRGYHSIIPQVGEKIICTKNNKKTRMFNGLIATITSVTESDESCYILDLVDEMDNQYLNIKARSEYFEGNDHPKLYGETFFDLFEYAYAITGHKSQGSQWDHVIVVQEKMFRENLDIRRRWIYTTTTRAAKRLTLISKNL